MERIPSILMAFWLLPAFVGVLHRQRLVNGILVGEEHQRGRKTGYLTLKH